MNKHWLVAALTLMFVLAVGAVGSIARADQPSIGASSDEQAQAVVGNWLTAKRDGIIQISMAADGHYEGRIVGGDAPGRVDEKNPDPARRGQQLLGLTILRGMKYNGRGRWSGGTIYDPDSGHTYRCRLELLGHDRLRVRGFLGLAVIGRSQVWTRYTGSSLQLPAAGR